MEQEYGRCGEVDLHTCGQPCSIMFGGGRAVREEEEEEERECRRRPFKMDNHGCWLEYYGQIVLDAIEISFLQPLRCARTVCRSSPLGICRRLQRRA